MNNKDLFINDLYLFYRYFIASDYQNSVPAPHIKTLAHELMKLMVTDDYHRLAVSMPPRHLLADSTPILTHNRGWTTHGDLKIGDYVYGLNGKPTEIVGISPKQECDRLISFSNGEQILAHKKHLWSVHKRGNKEKQIQVIPTEEIEKDTTYYTSNKKRHRYHLPLIEPITYEEKELPIDSYWLGLWLGDGTSTKPCITHSKEDNQFITNVPYEVSRQHIHKETGVYTTYFSNQNITEKLKELNIYDNKHIPTIYKEAPIKERKRLLAGLIDSDGNVGKDGRVRFTNTNKRLIDDVYELCTGLALYPYMMTPVTPEKINKYKENSNSLQIKSKKTSYVIGFQPRYAILTKVPRKKITEKGLRRRIAITDIKKIEESEMGHCIEVEAEDGIYLVGEKLIPTHNSKSSMVTFAFPLWLIFQNPNRNILIVTTGGLTEKFGIKIREYVREYGEHFNCYLSDVKQASTYIMFCDKTGKLYKGSIRLTGMGGSVTGQDADVIILDDPYKGLDEEFTPTALQKKIDYAERVLEQRIEPHTRYCVLHTRWVENDLIGHYMKTQPHLFKFINFSAIQPNGEPLWREKYTITELLTKKQNMGDRMFSAIYQQIPLDMTSDFFKMENIKHQGLDEDETIVRTVRSWDIAGADNMKGDYTCGALLSLTNKDNILLHNIVHGKFGQDTSNIIRNTAVKDGKDVTVLLETGVAGAGYLLFQSWKEQLKGFRVEQCKPVKSKVDRATPLRNVVFDGQLKLDFPLGDGKKRVLLDEFASFPNGEHDDIVDSVAWGVNWLKFEFGGQRSVKPGLVRIRR